MDDAPKEIEVNKESSHLKTASVQLERLMPSQIEQFTQGNSSNCNKSLLTLTKWKRKYQFGEIKEDVALLTFKTELQKQQLSTMVCGVDVEVGSRFGTKYEMKVKCVHVSDRNVHHIKDGVLSLLVTPTDRDFGDIISICIPEKRHEVARHRYTIKTCYCWKGRMSQTISNSFHEHVTSLLPIRVIRGAIGGHYSPLIGYRYDGLYRVQNAWDELCQDTNIIYHNFDLIRQAGQPMVYEQPPLFQSADLSNALVKQEVHQVE